MQKVHLEKCGGGKEKVPKSVNKHYCIQLRLRCIEAKTSISFFLFSHQPKLFFLAELLSLQISEQFVLWSFLLFPPAYWLKKYPPFDISFVRIRIVVYDSLLNDSRLIETHFLVAHFSMNFFSFVRIRIVTS